MSPTEKCLAVLLLTAVAAPLAGLVFRRVAGGWDSLGKGALAIEQELSASRHSAQPAAPVDPAIQAAEVRQMLEAKSARRQRRGEGPLDVEREAARLLGAAGEAAAAAASGDATLRVEVRQLVVARNERRLRKGLEPLDVEAETERQLADLIGSR